MASHETTWDPTYRYVTSWILPPKAFFAYRAAVSAFIFATRIYYCIIFATGQYSGSHEQATWQFSYLTGLTNFGQAFYFLFAALHTLTYLSRGRPWLSSWPAPLRHAHAALYSTILVCPPIVTVVYWAIIYSGSSKNTFIDIAQHALNSVWVLSELILPRTPRMPWLNVIVVVVLGALYIGLAYLTRATRGVYVYSFLDPANGAGSVVGYCLGLLAAAAVLFVVMNGLIGLRRWMTEEKLGMRGKFAARHVGSGGNWGVAGDAEKGRPTAF